jgi:probable biosynthetic protein (TIGR04099 family)
MHHSALLEETPAHRFIASASEPVTLGMPGLCRAGLSESWLWKACGHQHWMALARAHGLEAPDFRAADGGRLYAAFVDATLRQGKLDSLGENDRLSFQSVLERTGNTRFNSLIHISCAGRTVAEVAMASVFLGRRVAGRNLSVARAPVARPCSLTIGPRQEKNAATRTVPGPAATARAKVLAPFAFDPDPHNEFNGADFLYFASFPAMADRAEWAWLRRVSPLLTTRERHIGFHGNIELGDRVTIIARGLEEAPEAGTMTLWSDIHRQSDGALIASIRTTRGAAATGY